MTENAREIFDTLEQLAHWFTSNRMSLTEKFPECGFVYFDQDRTQNADQNSGRVYWNVETNQENQETIHLAVQHGEASEETLALILEGVTRYLALRRLVPPEGLRWETLDPPTS